MTYTPPMRPYAHQAEAIAKRDGKENFALFMEMRTGKTKTLLDDFGRLELAGKVKNLLVLAPGGVYRTWEAAAAEHLSLDLRKRLLGHSWASGNGVKELRKRDAFAAARDRPRMLLMNIEALSSVQTARDFAAAFLQTAPAMLTVDESTIIKNPTSKRTKFVNRTLAGLATYRRILCGLPNPKSPLDLYSQFEFLDWHILGFKSYYAFKSRYAIEQAQFYGGRRVSVVVGYQNLEDLQQRIEPAVYRKRLEDCYDLPPKIYSIREVPLTSEQKQVYEEMLEYSTAQLKEGVHITATIAIAQILRLHQILCGHTVDELGVFHEIPEKRTEELLALLEEYNGKAIVWCSYDADVKKVAGALAHEYGTAAVARFWGGNVSDREEEEKRFSNDPACRFMVATAAAGGRGRTWTVANLVVYYSNSHDLEHRAQSEERAQGIGKKTSVAYVDLVAPGTIDEKIIHTLRNKITLSSAVMGDGYREWLI